jgi:hypothetical protein
MEYQNKELCEIVKTSGINKKSSDVIMDSFSGQGISILNLFPKLPRSSLQIVSNAPIVSEEPGPKNPVAAYNLRNAMTKEHRIRARERWFLAIQSVKKITKATSLFKIRPDVSLAYKLKSFHSKRDVANHTRVQMYKSTSPDVSSFSSVSWISIIRSRLISV